MNPISLDTIILLQRLIVERALTLAQELEATAGSAPTGQIIDRCESLHLGEGREFLHRALEDAFQAQAAGATFAEAAGDVELQLDGTTVNTIGEWRGMKIGIFARREPGKKATSAEWESRDLPRPTAPETFAAIESIDRFAPWIGEWANRLGLTETPAITTLGDEAAWIWNAAAEQWPGSGGVVDISHAAEHISEAGKKLFGEGTAAAKDWLEGGWVLVLSDGWPGLCDQIGASLLKVLKLSGHPALGELTSDFAAHTERLNYAHRLNTGQSIGSGLVESGPEPDRQASQANRGEVRGQQAQLLARPRGAAVRESGAINVDLVATGLPGDRQDF